jgi:hypothetical protein
VRGFWLHARSGWIVTQPDGGWTWKPNRTPADRRYLQHASTAHNYWKHLRHALVIHRRYARQRGEL